MKTELVSFHEWGNLVEFKEGENFNRRNTLRILRIKIWAWRSKSGKLAICGWARVNEMNSTPYNIAIVSRMIEIFISRLIRLIIIRGKPPGLMKG